MVFSAAAGIRGAALATEHQHSVEHGVEDWFTRQSSGGSQCSQTHGCEATRYQSEASTSSPSSPPWTKGESVTKAQWSEILEKKGLRVSVTMSNLAHSGAVFWIDDDCFMWVLSIMIMVNVVVIGLECDLNRDPSKGHLIWKLQEYIFACFWCFEVVARWYFYRRRYFYDIWNLLDVFLALLSLFEVIVIGIIWDSASTKWGFFRALRVFRLLRLLRLVRRIQVCKELWMILLGFMEALKTLGWVFLLLALFIYAGGIYMTLIVGQQCADNYES